MTLALEAAGLTGRFTLWRSPAATPGAMANRADLQLSTPIRALAG